MSSEPEYPSGRLRQRLRTMGHSKDVLLGLVLLVFSLVTLLWIIPTCVDVPQAGGMAVKPNFFPYSIAAILVLLSIALIIKGGKTVSDSQGSEEGEISPAVIIVVGLLFCTYFGIKLLGMVPAGIISVAVLIRLFNYRNWPRTILFSVVFVILLFIFFEKVAQVSIPRGWLFEDLY